MELRWRVWQRRFRIYFFRRGGVVFLLGVLQKCVSKTWFFDGESVVMVW